MPRDDSAYLLDMLLAGRDALSFTEDLSFKDFLRDRRTELSVLRTVEIVGEAAAQLGEDARRAIPDVPWREIVGMRDRLVHGDFSVKVSSFSSAGWPAPDGHEMLTSTCRSSGVQFTTTHPI